MSKSSLACALAAAVLAAVAVAEHRPGLALALVLLLVGAAGVLTAGRRRASAGLALLAAGLAVQPAMLDAGWVVAIDVVAALVAGAAATVAPQRWPDVRAALLAPWRWVGGAALAGRAVASGWPAAPAGHLRPVARGVVIAVALVGVFGALFASADRAFAEAVGGTVDVRVDGGELTWRIILAATFLAVAGAQCRAAAPATLGPARPWRWQPARAELVVPLAAVVALFAAFVAVQLRVLFGGAAYVQETTGLGYGEYARHGFVQLVAAAALTIGVIAVAARSRERAVRALLGALSLLTLVVLASAHHRLDLVEDAYGATRVRYAGHAIVAWISVIFLMILATGVHPRLARHLPRAVTVFTLAGVLAFSLTNPDRHIAQTAVDRAAAGKAIDTGYLSGLSADALPALEQLPPADRARVVPEVRERLDRPDGIAGWNLSRAQAR